MTLLGIKKEKQMNQQLCSYCPLLRCRQLHGKAIILGSVHQGKRLCVNVQKRLHLYVPLFEKALNSKTHTKLEFIISILEPIKATDV